MSQTDNTIPEMEASDFRQCVNCVHLGKDPNHKDKIVCGAYRAYVEVAGQLSKQFGWVEWDHCMQDPAEKCDNFIPNIGMISDLK